MPAEACSERFEKEPECVRHNRREADHDAKKTGQDDLPAGISDIGFIDQGAD